MAVAVAERVSRLPPLGPEEGRRADPESEEMRMIRRISSVAVALAVSLSAAAAGAQEAPGTFGGAGQFVIGAERMFGFTSSNQKTSLEGGGVTTETTESFSQFSLLGLHGVSAYSIPRIGFDYFVIDRLSVGGSLMFVTTSSETEQDVGGVSASADGPSNTTFVFAPRVGYAFMFNEMIGIWPRAGFTYYSSSTEVESPVGTAENNENGLALALEGLFVIAPINHVGFTVGPTFDIGLTGGVTTKAAAPGSVEQEADKKVTDIGVNAGLMVWF